MLRGALSTLASRFTYTVNLVKVTNRLGLLSPLSKTPVKQQCASFTLAVPSIVNLTHNPSQYISKCINSKFLEPHQVRLDQARTVIKFSITKGKRKSVAAVRKRFFRLHWGAWIRPISGRHKKLWKKSARKRNYLLKHVFCNATQCRMLDKMVNKFWRKPKYYIEDPYAPYHKRENFNITSTKPWRPEGVDYE